MKNVVLKDALPTKRDNIVFCRLSELQLRVYRRVLELVSAASDCQREVDAVETAVWLSVVVSWARYLKDPPVAYLVPGLGSALSLTGFRLGVLSVSELDAVQAGS